MVASEDLSWPEYKTRECNKITPFSWSFMVFNRESYSHKIHLQKPKYNIQIK